MKEVLASATEKNVSFDSSELSNSKSDTKGNNEPSTTANKKINVQKLKHKLGFGAIFLITLNAILASSLTYLPGVGMQMAGVASLLAWVGVFLLGIYIAVCLSELVAMFPKTGDLYNFSKVAHGNFPAFIVGWTTWIAGNIGASLAVVWAIEYMFPIATKTAFLIKLGVAIGIVLALNAVALFGMKLSNVMLSALAIMTLFLLAIEIIPLFVNVQGLFATGTLTSNFHLHHFIPFFSTSGIGANLLLLAGTLFIISEAFMGMETITFLAKDTEKPERTIPKALLAAITTAAILTLVYVIGSIGAFPLEKYLTAILPHKEILMTLWQGKLMPLLLGGTGIIILAPAAVWVVTGPRLLMSMAKDKLFIKQLDKVNQRTKTPINAILFQTIIISIMTAFIYHLYIVGFHDPYKLIHEEFILLVLFVLSFTIVAVSKLRKRNPEITRPFKAPMGKVGPYLVVLIFLASISAYVFITKEYNIITKAITLIGMGIPIYLLLTFYYDPEATIRFQNETSTALFFLERLFFPKRIEKKLLENSQIQGRKILELGASSGLISQAISKREPAEQIIIEQSESLTKFIKKRLKNAKNVRCIYDEHLTARVHPDVKEVNEIFSFGILSNLYNEEIYLKDLAALLPEHGRIHIFDYVDMYKIIPNKELLSGDMKELKKLFRDAGFAIKIRKEKGILWNYLIIDGIKTRERDVIFI